MARDWCSKELDPAAYAHEFIFFPLHLSGTANGQEYFPKCILTHVASIFKRKNECVTGDKADMTK